MQVGKFLHRNVLEDYQVHFLRHCKIAFMVSTFDKIAACIAVMHSMEENHLFYFSNRHVINEWKMWHVQ